MTLIFERNFANALFITLSIDFGEKISSQKCLMPDKLNALTFAKVQDKKCENVGYYIQLYYHWRDSDKSVRVISSTE